MTKLDHDLVQEWKKECDHFLHIHVEADTLTNVFGSEKRAIEYVQRAKNNVSLIIILCRITGAHSYSQDCLDDLIYVLEGGSI